MIRKIVTHPVTRYVFFGALATLVNFVVYYLLRTYTIMDVGVANILSVLTAMMFAFVTNSVFVFQSQARGFREHFAELIKFVGARLSTMVIEVGGVWFMADVLHINDLVGKFFIQFVVLVLNFIFSKFLVFRKKTAD